MVGEYLKKERLNKKLSLEDISNELKIPRSFLFKIEENQITKNDNLVYTLGYIRSYSNFLYLDADHIIDTFKREHKFNSKNIPKQISKPIVSKSFYTQYKLLPVSIFIIIFLSSYFIFFDNRTLNRQYAIIPDIPESSIPTFEKAILENNNYDTNNQTEENKKSDSFSNNSAIAFSNIDTKNIDTLITLKFTKPTWLQIRDNEENIVLSKLMSEDDEYSYEILKRYRITSGNAGNILVLIDNKVRGKVGKLGDVIDSFIIDADFSN